MNGHDPKIQIIIANPKKVTSDVRAMLSGVNVVSLWDVSFQISWVDMALQLRALCVTDTDGCLYVRLGSAACLLPTDVQSTIRSAVSAYCRKR